MTQETKDLLEKTMGILVKADSMLSFIYHRGRVDFTDRPGFHVTKMEVEHRIGEIRRQSEHIQKVLHGEV